ncbi:dimethyl sulfoxide reductase, subunit A1 [Salmonella enterica subsp. enterica serovar Daytona]|uniref:Dimethyl sulfoxide reductase, subunit A1 n=1 Tax=Salmonella enterica subsp. enterica serovar Daytona TaxID=1962639 RepID=A0A447JHU0_SALET|nr:dimethyl sulfoxide reductase, subunit A1 [Salmonella enterica subsp. enterica serovar Daytona]
MPYTYGSNDGNSTSDIENSKLVVMFGNNPAETRMSGGGITWFLEQARERSNARMIVIDPRYTDTAAGREGRVDTDSPRHRRRAGGGNCLGID